MLDVGKRYSKISFEILKWFIGSGSASQGIQDTSLDLQPGREKKQTDAARGKLSEAQYEICRDAARKIVAANLPLLELLSAKDQNKEGFVSCEDIVSAITDKRVANLQPSELNLLVTYADRSERGFLVIPSFVAKIEELA